MLYDLDNPVLAPEAVSRLRWEGNVFTVAPRRYAALAYRIRGSAVIGCGGRHYTVGPKDVLYLPKGLGYTAEYTDTELIVIHFFTARDDDAPEVYTPGDSRQICEWFRQAHEEWEHKRPGYEARVMGVLYTVLGTLAAEAGRGGASDAFGAAMEHLHTHYTSPALSVGSLCAAAGMGETAFRRRFRQQYRQTPVEYITARRLEYARDLIAGGMSVEEAACRSGFTDPKYFARVVKKHFACTPRELKLYAK